MSFNRSYTILIKDIYWTLSNLRIAGLLIVPLATSLLFNQVGTGILSSVSYTFTISFIGIFITALSVTEEKKSDTLFSLLTTPLRGSEFIFGKIITSLILCIVFCLAASFLNNVAKDFLNIYFVVNLLLFSLIASSLGCFLGLLCKNEQVLSIVVTPLMLIFAMGTFFSDLIFLDFQSSFLPDYHFVKSIGIASGSKANLHTLFNAFICLVFMGMTISYVNFYFRYGREKFLSKMIMLQVLTLFIPLLLSGYIFTSERESINKKISNEKSITIKEDYWNIEILQDKVSINLLKKNILFTNYTAKLENGNEKIDILIRKPKRRLEDTQDLRRSTFRKKNEVVFFEVVPIGEHRFDKWVYLSKGSMTMTYELYHNVEILIFSIKKKSSKIQDISKMKTDLESLISKTKIKHI